MNKLLLWLRRCAPLVLCLVAFAAQAGEAAPAVEDPVLEKRVMAIAAELRCLVCQNQTIADSNAELAVDLRNQVREMLRKGQTQDDIVAYMTARYGAVSYTHLDVYKRQVQGRQGRGGPGQARGRGVRGA